MPRSPCGAHDSFQDHAGSRLDGKDISIKGKDIFPARQSWGRPVVPEAPGGPPWGTPTADVLRPVSHAPWLTGRGSREDSPFRPADFPRGPGPVVRHCGNLPGFQFPDHSAAQRSSQSQTRNSFGCILCLKSVSIGILHILLNF